MSHLQNLANKIGLDAIDDEVVEWIASGYYDDAVVSRARKIDHPSPMVEYIQSFHASFHKDSTWGYEHCSRCDTILKEYR